MLSGERVVLRPRRPEDLDLLHASQLDPVTWARTTAAPLVPMTLDQYRARLAEPGGGDGAAFFAVEVEGRLVGQASLFHVDPLSRTAELGLTMLPGERGRGYGRDALRTLVEYGFRSRNLRRLHLEVLASNEPALRCYRAVGFVEEGRLREHAWVEGRYDDAVRMAVLRAEWPPSAQTESPSR